ncbi:MAG: methyltransferase domain-containing protein [Terrimicrobiaceae bacterium]|nr:TPMT family class I SAM-dependent methyltransferase [Terrimicrobiaceae bacterium]
MVPDGSAGRDWEASYQAGEIPWDKGRPHPALVDWLSRNRLTGSILVPGSGTGHDVRALASDPQANVIGLDLAPSAKVMAESFGKRGNEAYLTGDFLSEFPLAAGSFDAIFEHTCFCAIPPGRRPDYARAVSKSTKPGGFFLAIFYRNPSPRGEPGPPFGCSMEEVDALFGNEFQLIEEHTHIPTFDGREDREVLRLMQRKPA